MADAGYGGLASAFLSFAGNQITNEMNAEQHASDMGTYLHVLGKQREWQKQDQQWSEDASKRLFDYESAYNSPSAQMARYQKAGLNPYLLMQQGQIGSGNGQGMPAPNPSARASVSPFIRPDLGNPTHGLAENIFAGSSIKSQRIVALAEFAKSLPDLVKSVGKDAAKRIAGSFLGKDINMNRVDTMVENEAVSQEAEKTQQVVKANIANLYGEKFATNALALQEQAFSKVTAELNLMHTEAEKNRKQIHLLAAQYCESVARAYNLKKQGDIYSVQGYILDNIKDYNISLQRLALQRAQRQDYAESAMFESNRDVFNYMRNDPEAKSVQLENYINRNDTFWNEVNVIMSSWQVHTNVGFTGSYGSKDVYGHGFGYDD